MTVTAGGLRGGEYVGFGRRGADGRLPSREVPADAERTVAIVAPVIVRPSRPDLPVWSHRVLTQDPVTPDGVAECQHRECEDRRHDEGQFRARRGSGLHDDRQDEAVRDGDERRNEDEHTDRP